MNTACTWWLDDDDGGHACGEDTVRGRSHCETHRGFRLSELSRRRSQTQQAADAATMDYFTYLGEGYTP